MKITRATLKSFVKKNKENLFINVKSDFDGMIDGCVDVRNGFQQAIINELAHEYTLGICGVWLVGNSRDYFTKYEDENFEGIEVSNCCGRFIAAIRKS